MAMNFHRQLAFYNPYTSKTKGIVVVGAGGIGSPLTLALAKMGVKPIYVYDFDKVVEHNIPNQLYSPSSIGRHKVHALSALVHKLTGERIMPYPSRWGETEKTPPFDILISAVDSISSRREIWETVKDRNITLIDPRMGGEVMEVHVVRPKKDAAYYEGTLHADPLPLACTARAIIYTSFAISAITADVAKKVINGEDCPRRVVFDMKNFLIIKEDNR